MADGRMTPAGRKAADEATRGTHYVGPDKGADDTSATDKAKAQDTTRLKAKNETGFPKRASFKSDSDYHAAIKSFRNKQQGQLEALK